MAGPSKDEQPPSYTPLTVPEIHSLFGGPDAPSAASPSSVYHSDEHEEASKPQSEPAADTQTADETLPSHVSWMPDQRALVPAPLQAHPRPRTSVNDVAEPAVTKQQDETQAHDGANKQRNAEDQERAQDQERELAIHPALRADSADYLVVKHQSKIDGLILQIQSLQLNFEAQAKKQTVVALLNYYCRRLTASLSSGKESWIWGTYRMAGVNSYVAVVDVTKPGTLGKDETDTKVLTAAHAVREQALWKLVHLLERSRCYEKSNVQENAYLKEPFDQGAVDPIVLAALDRACELYAARTPKKKDKFMWDVSFTQKDNGLPYKAIVYEVEVEGSRFGTNYFATRAEALSALLDELEDRIRAAHEKPPKARVYQDR